MCLGFRTPEPKVAKPVLTPITANVEEKKTTATVVKATKETPDVPAEAADAPATAETTEKPAETVIYFGSFSLSTPLFSQSLFLPQSMQL
jgi:hypothetical protein